MRAKVIKHSHHGVIVVLSMWYLWYRL